MDNAEDKQFKILYIGNDPDNKDCLETSVLFHVKQLDTVIEAVNYLKLNQDIDAVLAETHLPGNDGIQAFDLLTKRNVIKEIPFILVTFQYEPEMSEKAFAKGIYDYYRTPIDDKRIYERILFFKSDTNKLLDAKVMEQSEKPSVSPPIEKYKTPIIKRIFDILVAGTALLMLSPLLLVVILAIKLDSKGSFYYISKRVGANMRVFGFYKLRSMRLNADKEQKDLSHLNQYVKEEAEDVCSECAKLPPGEYCSQVHWEEKDLGFGKKGEVLVCQRIITMRKNSKSAFLKLENDPRITKIGKFIRNTSIDELPQLVNIIKGDMSIVGNRPLPVDEANMLSFDSAGKRFDAAAGLTGLWQVELRGQGGEMSEETRFKLDANYAEKNTFWGDMKLIFRTFKIFIQPGNV